MHTKEYLGYYVARAFKALKKPITQIVRKYGLTVQQYAVLRRLNAQDGMPARDLVNQLFIDSSTIMAIIDRLEKKGFVRRESNPTDRRINNIFLTNRAKKIIPQLIAEAEALDRKMRDLLTQEEIRALESGLTKLYEFATLTEKKGFVKP